MTGPPHISGVGAVTGYGWDAAALWAGVTSGVSAGREQDVDGEELLVARVPDRPLGDAVTRLEAALLGAVDEATTDARARGWGAAGRLGVVHCTGIGDIALARDGYFRDARMRPSTFPHVLHTTAASLVAMRLGATGPNVVVNGACASANIAVLLARSWIDQGWCDDVIVTAAEFCVIREVLHGFRQLQVLVARGDPLEQCVPFNDEGRGFFLGEAAVAFVVGGPTPRPYVRVLGGSHNHDAHHIAAIDADAVQVVRCFTDALADGDVAPAGVAYVNAHGSATKLNDLVEHKAARATVPAARIYGTKHLTGHCMAASGAVELAVAALTYDRDVVPGLPARPGLREGVVAGGEPRAPGATACSAIGIGGYNSVLLIDEPQG